MNTIPKSIVIIRRIRRVLVCILAGLLVVLILLGVLRRQRHTVTPDRNAVFTSTRYVTSLALTPDGSVWVGTLGGLLRRSQTGTWQKFTRLEGLPAHEVRSIALKDGAVQVMFPNVSAIWNQGRWQTAPSAPPPPTDNLLTGQTCATVWRGVDYVATVQGLYVRAGKQWQPFPLPSSRGTHISALCPHGTMLWAALFGDGLWAFDGRHWQPLNVGLPPQAREITALVANDSTLWVGTRSAGVWEGHNGHWTQYLQPDEPVGHDCQACAMFAGNLFVSTLEDGLAVRTPRGWGHYRVGTLSSNAPRQMIVFANMLYVRNGSGKVDAFDGTHWRRDVCAGLPRKQASALAADGMRLYVAQWGGWSEFDGKTWTHHLDLPELQGVPITALCPDGDRLWVGTQGRGVAEVVRATGTLRWHDERDGLPDDWVTVLARVKNTVYAGTFVGGLAQWTGGRWTTFPALNGQNVTALAPDDAGELFIATRSGVWHRTGDGSLSSLDTSARFLDPEAQTLCKVDGGLWIGARTGLFFCSDLTPGGGKGKR
jgi:ligand-binding sensor domain-containing protein